MEIFGEFDGVKWGDVGIAPYEPPGGAQESRKGKLHKDQRRFSLFGKTATRSKSIWLGALFSYVAQLSFLLMERFFLITDSF